MENTLIKNNQIESLKNDAIKLLAKANEVAVITSPDEEVRAAEFTKQADLRLDKAETQRLFIVKPLKTHIKTIEDEFHTVTDPLKKAIEIVKAGMTRYRNSAEVIAAQDAAALALREGQSAARMGDLDTMNQKAAELAQAQSYAPKAVITDSGKVTYRDTWKWEIEDVNVIPDEFFIVDEKLVTKFVKTGLPIKGIKIWKESSPVIH